MQRILAADFYQISVVKPRSLHYVFISVFLTAADMMCQKIRHRTKTTDKLGLNQIPFFVSFHLLLLGSAFSDFDAHFCVIINLFLLLAIKPEALRFVR